MRPASASSSRHASILIRQQRHDEARVSPEQHRARDRRGSEAFANLVERGVERVAARTAARAGRRDRRRGSRPSRRRASARDARSSASPRRAASSRSRGSRASREVGHGSVCERVAREKSAKRSRRTTVRPTRWALRMPARRRDRRARRATASTSSATGARAAERALRADRAAAAPDLHAPRVTVVRERVQVRPDAAAEHRDERGSSSAATSPTVVIAAAVQLLAP